MSIPKLKIDEYTDNSYPALEYVASVINFIGWLTIFFSIILAIGTIIAFGSVFPLPMFGGEMLHKLGLSNGYITARGSYFPIVAGLFVFLSGAFMGALQIAIAELIHVAIDIGDDISVSTREQLNFYEWYEEKERAKEK